MKRTLRLGLTIVALGGLIAAGVLLALSPWSGDGPVEEAVASPAEYGICNVSVTGIPDGVDVGAATWPKEYQHWSPNATVGPSGRIITLMLSMDMPEGQHYRSEDPDTGELIDLRTRVVIDAPTGELLFEHYRTAAEEAKVKGVLATLHVGPWTPIAPAWPRTDTPPRSEVAEVHKPVGTPADYNVPILRYRQPERGAGLFAGMRQGDTFQDLRIYTCESIVVVDAGAGEVTQHEVVPEEAAMFERFLEEVEVP